MSELNRILTTQSAFLFAIARSLIAKGVITKNDLLNDATIQSYDYPLPPEVLSELQQLISSLPDR